MIVLQINTTLNGGSTGRISNDIGDYLIDNKINSYIGYSRKINNSKSNVIKIGNYIDILLHLFLSRFFDMHGFGSKLSTIIFIRKIKKIKPDVIHLHNIHGYFINIEILFKFLKKSKIPVVWTLHDCWPITGHCSYFDYVECDKWKLLCNNCPNLNGYPKSFFDNSRKNFVNKKNIFNSLEKIILICPSNWLKLQVENSFLKNINSIVIHNGIDISKFKPRSTKEQALIRKNYFIPNSRIVLGVANLWDRRKGFDDFLKLRNLLEDDFTIVLVGLNKKQISTLPSGMIGLERTNNVDELAVLYTIADVYVNPTYVDNFPTTNLEALSCGTPVVSYNTGGSPESINSKNGIVVTKGDVISLYQAIKTITSHNYQEISNNCRYHSLNFYNKNEVFKKYLDIYKGLVDD